ncbi:MAG TPA: hypothetical protein VHH34_08355, partial [Pseudonocardiaceae bacterium]|nr:hypothetical protein [Pseudonocardiaceae bacterium]
MIRSRSAGSRVAAYSCSQPVPAAAAARSPGLMATISLVVGRLPWTRRFSGQSSTGLGRRVTS